MNYTYDETKNQANIANHGISLSEAENLEWDSVLMVEDNRKDYGEVRYIAIGYIVSRLHVVVLTFRGGDIRVISLRKANKREVKRYEQR